MLTLNKLMASSALAALLAFSSAGISFAGFDEAVNAYEAGDYKTAMNEWMVLAEKNDPAAMRNIGHLYRLGLGTDVNYERALHWYKRASELGFARAQANVASMYLKGQGVPQDYVQAADWFTKAARNGHTIAQYNLGLMYEYGKGVEKSTSKALAWYNLAAKAGHPKALNKLSILVATTPDVKAEAAEAEVAKETKVAAAEQKAAEAKRLWGAFFAAPGDDTRNCLVEWYQGLIAQIVRRFGARLPRSVDRGDLVTAANMGLISAIHGFDPERGVRFESYCELRVKGALLDELRSQDWLPRPWRQKIEQQKRTVETLRRELGREPGDGEVASSMGFALDVYQQTFGVGLPGTPSGSMPASDGSGDDGGSVSALDIVQDKAVETPGEQLSRDELLQLASQRMTDQERRIVYLKYWEEMPMREIGELTGLSESRVCKIHTRLIDRLQDRFRVNQEDESNALEAGY